MSSIDPALAAARTLVQAVDGAIADATLNLGASGAEIVAQLQTGDLLPAIVLAPQGGTDLLEIFGQTVAAQLPPGIHPGETIVLHVNGFDGNRILVSNLGVADPEHPPNLANVAVPEPSTAQPPVRATLTTVPRSAGEPVEPAQTLPPAAPPREVFVAASVRPSPLAPPSTGPRIEAIVEPDAGATDIEARMALTRSTPHAPPSTQAAALPPIVPAVPGVRAQPSVPLAVILTTQVRIPPARGVQAEVAPLAGDAATRLLARIRVPVTPATLAAARIANDAVASIPRAFARLEAVLPRELPLAAAPLRALLAFVSKFDLTNARALPEQIAAFVSHVVDGPEPKLAQALAAFADADTAPGPPSSSTSSPPPARAIERAAAYAFDLKTAVAALAQTVQADASPQLARAVSDALAATTGVQFGALSNAVADPSAISIALPAFFHDGGRPAQMRVDRDAPSGREPLDADNFRIGFVLETASLGTLAIDVETVGRSVRVDVRTERAPAAERINGTLPDLRARFEHLRYRVAAMSAGVVAPRAPSPPAQAPAPAAPAPGLDLQA